MLIKEVLQRRDQLKGYLHSLSIAQNYCDKHIGDIVMIEDLKSVYKEFEVEFKQIDESLRPFENMDM